MGGRKADGCKQCSCPAPKMAQPLRHFFSQAHAFVSILTRPWGRVQPQPRTAGLCALVVSILTRPWGRVQPISTAYPIRKRLFHLFHAPRREKKPRAVLGGARLAVRGAIIPNCDHARKVGGNASPACNSSAPFEIIHNGRCIPAKLGCCSARINQSNRVFLKAPRSTVFGTAQVGGGSSEGGMRRVRGDWACSRGGHGRVRGAIRRA